MSTQKKDGEKLTVKFLGCWKNCNPQHKRWELVDYLRKQFPDCEISPVKYHEDDDDGLFLLLNSCLTGCARIPEDKPNIIRVKGMRFNDVDYETQEELQAAVAEEVRRKAKEVCGFTLA